MQWVERWNRRTRLPSECERCFFKQNGESEILKARLASRYAEHVGVLDDQFENLIKTDAQSIVRYATVLARGGRVVPSFMEEQLKGDNSHLYDYARVRSSFPNLYPTARLPEELEQTFAINHANASVLTRYARDVLKSRLPREVEQKLFAGDEHTVARLVYSYAEAVSAFEPMDFELEKLISLNADCLFNYHNHVAWSQKKTLDTRLWDNLAGNSQALLRYASQIIKGRLPKHLEDTLDDPRVCLTYAKDILKSRLPEHLENVFLKDVDCAYNYAFTIIRGFSSPKLPEVLHSMMLMKSYDPNHVNDRYIKEYVRECERADKGIE